jgi:hypothetical protein
MSETPLSRRAGPIAVTAGTLFAVVHLALFAVMDRSDLVAMTADPVFRVVNIAYAAMFPLLLIALVAVHERQSRTAGVLGTIGFCAALVGTMSLGANMWFEAFAVPWLVEVFPAVLTVEKTGTWPIGYLTSYAFFALGWVLFGLSCLRARVFPTSISIAIALGGVVGIWAALPPFGVPIGLAVAALGAWLIRSDRMARPAAEPATL